MVIFFAFESDAADDRNNIWLPRGVYPNPDSPKSIKLQNKPNPRKQLSTKRSISRKLMRTRILEIE